jgi:NADPH2:quinone reductase
LPHRELVPVPPGVDPAEAVSLVLNYVTAYQMLHRSARAEPGQRVLVHGASGGVGTALLQLARLVGLEMYGTCSPRSAAPVADLGATPIDYHQGWVEEIDRLTGDGVDAVFDPIGGRHIWESRQALRPGGRVVVYGNTTSLRGGLASGRPARRPLTGIATIGLYTVRAWLLPGRRRVVPYSIQWLKRLRPAVFRQDLATLLDLLEQRRIEPLVAPRAAQELLENGGVTGKIVPVRDGSSPGAAAA